MPRSRNTGVLRRAASSIALCEVTEGTARLYSAAGSGSAKGSGGGSVGSSSGAGGRDVYYSARALY